jgi:hypothetical protein
MPEPRDPLLKVLTIFISTQTALLHQGSRSASAGAGPGTGVPRRPGSPSGPAKATGVERQGWEGGPRGPALGNDPSAGSPTETLLRLLLPLNDQV